jgi:hypothetical protein
VVYSKTAHSGLPERRKHFGYMLGGNSIMARSLMVPPARGP